jgi:hypothetical protein
MQVTHFASEKTSFGTALATPTSDVPVAAIISLVDRGLCPFASTASLVHPEDAEGPLDWDENVRCRSEVIVVDDPDAFLRLCTNTNMATSAGLATIAFHCDPRGSDACLAQCRRVLLEYNLTFEQWVARYNSTSAANRLPRQILLPGQSMPWGTETLPDGSEIAGVPGDSWAAIAFDPAQRSVDAVSLLVCKSGNFIITNPLRRGDRDMARAWLLEQDGKRTLSALPALALSSLNMKLTGQFPGVLRRAVVSTPADFFETTADELGLNIPKSDTRAVRVAAIAERFTQEPAASSLVEGRLYQRRAMSDGVLADILPNSTCAELVLRACGTSDSNAGTNGDVARREFPPLPTRAGRIRTGASHDFVEVANVQFRSNLSQPGIKLLLDHQLLPTP